VKHKVIYNLYVASYSLTNKFYAHLTIKIWRGIISDMMSLIIYCLAIEKVYECPLDPKTFGAEYTIEHI